MRGLLDGKSPTQTIQQEPELRQRGKRGALEVQGLMSGNGDSGLTSTTGKKAQKDFGLEQKGKALELLNKGTKHAEIARRQAGSERMVSPVAWKKGKLEQKTKSPGFNGKTKSKRLPGFPDVRDQHDANTECAVLRHSLASFASFSYRSVHAYPRQRWLHLV